MTEALTSRIERLEAEAEAAGGVLVVEVPADADGNVDQAEKKAAIERGKISTPNPALIVILKRFTKPIPECKLSETQR